MIELVHRYVLPAAYEVLPPKMQSPEATALLLAIGLQESRFEQRRQQYGPARGLWQFEVGGVRGVLEHPRTRVPIQKAIVALCYGTLIDEHELQPTLEHNDILAACFARCLLWALPGVLPLAGQTDEAWHTYVRTWRPGKPHRAGWNAYYREAWARVQTPDLG